MTDIFKVKFPFRTGDTYADTASSWTTEKNVKRILDYDGLFRSIPRPGAIGYRAAGAHSRFAGFNFTGGFNFAISSWFKPGALSADGYIAYAIGAGGAGVLLQVNQADYKVRTRVVDRLANAVNVDSDATAVLGQWNHIVANFDFNTNELKVQLNGTPNAAAGNIAAIGDVSSVANYTFYQGNDSVGNNYINGDIALMTIFITPPLTQPVMLTEQDMGLLYEYPAQEYLVEDIVNYWRGDVISAQLYDFAPEGSADPMTVQAPATIEEFDYGPFAGPSGKWAPLPIRSDGRIKSALGITGVAPRRSDGRIKVRQYGS